MFRFLSVEPLSVPDLTHSPRGSVVWVLPRQLGIPIPLLADESHRSDEFSADVELNLTFYFPEPTAIWRTACLNSFLLQDRRRLDPAEETEVAPDGRREFMALMEVKSTIHKLQHKLDRHHLTGRKLCTHVSSLSAHHERSRLKAGVPSKQ